MPRAALSEPEPEMGDDQELSSNDEIIFELMRQIDKCKENVEVLLQQLEDAGIEPNIKEPGYDFDMTDPESMQDFF